MKKMNSTKILFLKMLKGDILRDACSKVGIDISQVTDSRRELLTGQTIKRSEIESFLSYKMMTVDERAIVNSCLEELKRKESATDAVRGKALLKNIDALVPRSEVSITEYNDVM